MMAALKECLRQPQLLTCPNYSQGGISWAYYKSTKNLASFSNILSCKAGSSAVTAIKTQLWNRLDKENMPWVSLGCSQMGLTSCRKCPEFPSTLHYGELHNYFIIYYNAVIIEIKCKINAWIILKPSPSLWLIENCLPWTLCLILKSWGLLLCIIFKTMELVNYLGKRDHDRALQYSEVNEKTWHGQCRLPGNRWKSRHKTCFIKAKNRDYVNKCGTHTAELLMFPE